MEDLLRRCLVTLPPEHWETLIPELQLTVNTTYARSIGCAPYLVMFGADSPSTFASAMPDPTKVPVATYATAVRRQLETISKATAAAHAAYRKREARTIPPDPVTNQIQPGKLAMVTRPRTNKIITSNAGPFLVTKVQSPHIWLQSLTHGVDIKEHQKNVRPLHL